MKRSQWDRANTPEAKARTQAKREATKREGPAPCYDDYRPGADFLEVVIHGADFHHVICLKNPMPKGVRRPRSDQHDVTVDGQPRRDLRTLTAVFAFARGLVPRRMTRDELAAL